MIIPVRCFTCGKVIGNKWDTYLDLLQADYTEGDGDGGRRDGYDMNGNGGGAVVAMVVEKGCYSCRKVGVVVVAIVVVWWRGGGGGSNFSGGSDSDSNFSGGSDSGGGGGDEIIRCMSTLMHKYL
ncbi:hypothetical protein CsSME_00015886 [Camellia sinensis var. sinensis]